VSLSEIRYFILWIIRLEKPWSLWFSPQHPSMEIEVVRRGHLRWSDAMLLDLATTVFVHNAFMRVAGEGTAEDKYKMIATLLWKLPAFRAQGQAVAWNTLQHKFQTIFKSFRVRHGYGDEGQRTNISALSESSSELDKMLLNIHSIAARKEEADFIQKQTEEEDAKVLSNITDVIVGGGGVKGLQELSEETAKSSSSTSSSGVKQFSRMTKSPTGSSKKRERSQVDTEADKEMDQLQKIMDGENVRMKEEAEARKIEKAERDADRQELRSLIETLKGKVEDQK
jgi:hypothetical protein